MSRLCRQRQQQQQPRLRKAMQSALLIAWLAATVFIAEGQMDPTEMQRQIQQQMGGGSGGADGATSPNRIGQLMCAAGAGGVTLARSIRDHPRTAVATTAAAATALWAGAETQKSGLLVCRSPRISLFRPSDAYLSWVLERAVGSPVAYPLRGFIVTPLQDPEGDEEKEDESTTIELNSDERAGSKKKDAPGTRTGWGVTKARRTVGSGGVGLPLDSVVAVGGLGVGASEIKAVISRARNVESEGIYTEQSMHGRGRVKSVRAGVLVGKGLGIYHKFAQGLEKMDVFDGRSDCELLAAESSAEDLGSTLGLLTRSAMGAWSLSPVRVVLRRETTLPVPRVALGDENGRRRGSSRKGSSPRRSKTKRSKEKEEPEEEKEKADQCHRQYTLALSAVEGAGWSGTWTFRVTYDGETEEVWFQTSLAQRKGTFGTTVGGDQVARVNRVNEDMLERGKKHAVVLRTREEQFTRVSSLARERARDTRELKRDRVLHPDKYKRVHRYMRGERTRIRQEEQQLGQQGGERNEDATTFDSSSKQLLFELYKDIEAWAGVSTSVALSPRFRAETKRFI